MLHQNNENKPSQKQQDLGESKDIQSPKSQNKLAPKVLKSFDIEISHYCIQISLSEDKKCLSIKCFIDMKKQQLAYSYKLYYNDHHKAQGDVIKKKKAKADLQKNLKKEKNKKKQYKPPSAIQELIKSKNQEANEESKPQEQKIIFEELFSLKRNCNDYQNLYNLLQKNKNYLTFRNGTFKMDKNQNERCIFACTKHSDFHQNCGLIVDKNKNKIFVHLIRIKDNLQIRVFNLEKKQEYFYSNFEESKIYCPQCPQKIIDKKIIFQSESGEKLDLTQYLNGLKFDITKLVTDNPKKLFKPKIIKFQEKKSFDSFQPKKNTKDNYKKKNDYQILIKLKKQDNYRQIFLDYNHLVRITKYLGRIQMPCLKRLVLAHNGIRSLRGLQKLVFLQYLVLSENQLDKFSAQYLRDGVWPYLTTFDISYLDGQNQKCMKIMIEKDLSCFPRLALLNLRKSHEYIEKLKKNFQNLGFLIDWQNQKLVRFSDLAQPLLKRISGASAEVLSRPISY